MNRGGQTHAGTRMWVEHLHRSMSESSPGAGEVANARPVEGGEGSQTGLRARTALRARYGSGTLALADPMEPPLWREGALAGSLRFPGRHVKVPPSRLLK